MRNRRVNARKRAMRGRSQTNINGSLSTSVESTSGSIKTLCQHSPQSHFQTPCNPIYKMKMQRWVTHVYSAWLSKTDWGLLGSQGVSAAAQPRWLWDTVTVLRWWYLPSPFFSTNVETNISLHNMIYSNTAFLKVDLKEKIENSKVQLTW